MTENISGKEFIIIDDKDNKDNNNDSTTIKTPLSKEDILDFEIDEKLRLEEFCKLPNNNDTLELLKRISLMYQFSGSKVIESFLYNLCSANTSGMFKMEAVLSLLNYSETLEVINKSVGKKSKKDKIDSDEVIKLKNLNNSQVVKRNALREMKAYEALNFLLKNIYESDTTDLPLPCKIEITFLLMKCEKFRDEADTYFKNIINDATVDCNFRYKTILSLEKKSITDYKFFMKSACISFLKNAKNFTMVRIVAAQNLLQHFKLTEEESTMSQEIILSFASDTELDYNLRADAADLLLSLGSEYFSDIGRNIIISLGRIDGDVKTIYDDKQNVHTQKVEDSVLKILEVLSTQKVIKIDDAEIEFEYLRDKILEIASGDCKEDKEKYNKIELSLKRIDIDRILYFNNTLSKILIKLWSYINGNDNRDEMIKRLIEELEDMSGTCSSGFVSRLVNCLSGFGDFSIEISIDQQLVANFIGRLNAYARKITHVDSIFNGDKLYDVIELYLNSNITVRDKVVNMITGGDKSITKLPRMKIVVDKYLETERENKVKECLEDFEYKVLDEMTIDNIKFAKRQNFALFFRCYLPTLRHELYQEFRDFMEDTQFDLIIRKAIASYDGVNEFI